MDIDLFSEIVKGLILDNDEVTLPGLGTFVSEVVPSTFSDKGYTINPPYRRLSFRQRGSEDDRLLAEFYSKANGTDFETSRRILSEFIAGLRNTLQTKKIVVFPGLGRLRATKENTFSLSRTRIWTSTLTGSGWNRCRSRHMRRHLTRWRGVWRRFGSWLMSPWHRSLSWSKRLM